ncbi:MAG: enolase C-terminal domain-like protein [Acidimicrobiales bacterium]
MAALEPLPPLAVEVVEVLRLPMALDVRLPSARGDHRERDVLLVHVVARSAEGWAECPVEPTPGYSTETTGTTIAAWRDRLIPRALAGPPDGSSSGAGPAVADALALRRALAEVDGEPMASAALELAVLDAQLRTAGCSLAAWLGATATAVAPGAALGLHDDAGALLDEADGALAAGAVRLRVKVAPGRAARPLAALRDHVGSAVVLQADANGTFQEDDPELDALDELGLACLEQPLAPDDLEGHARLATRLRTPICLDEPLTSLAAIEAAVAMGACEVVCLKPSRTGWAEARRVHDRCAELGVPVWVGGMLDTALGRAANLAVAALPHLALPPDLDPRGRFRPDLADPRLPVDGLVPVPTAPGTDATPHAEARAAAEVVGAWSP